MASLNIKYSGGTKTINAKDTVPSTPYIQIKGVGYFPLQSNPSGAGVYVKQNDMIYKIQEKPKLVSWTSGTEEEITAMVNGYYDGTITLDEIQEVWNVGDRRYINISDISKNGKGTYSVGESHGAQVVQVAILDFNHDLLAAAQEGEIDKALVTLGQIGCLRDTEQYGQNNSEKGFINPETNGIGWYNCARRKWCNAGYYNALPSYLKTLVKQVIKSTANMTGSSPGWYATLDYCFLPSEREVFGANYHSAETGIIENHIGASQVKMPTGGTQYSYYKTSQNRYKTPRWSNNSKHYSSYWWERSPSKTDKNYFCYVSAIGGSSYTTMSNNSGIAPHFCI